MYNRKKTSLYRIITQIIGALVVNSHFKGIFQNKAIYQGDLKSFCVPVLNCYACPLARFSCPIGSIQVLFSQKTIPFYVFGTLIFFGLLLGRFTCGWLCPFGAFQDLLDRIRSNKIRSLPRWIFKMRYAFLILTVLLIPITFPFLFGMDANYSYFCKICPWGGLEGGLPLLAWNPSSYGAKLIDIKTLDNLFFLKLGVIAFVLVASVFVSRFFCRTMCPLGAILGLFNKVSLMQLRVDKGCDLCNGEHKCQAACPYNIPVYKEPNSPDCIRCLRCTHSCDAITLDIMGHKIKGISQKNEGEIVI